MTGNKTQRQWIGLSYRFATMLIALLFVATSKVNAQTPYFKVNGTTLTFYSVDGNDTQGGTKITEWGTAPTSTAKEKAPSWATQSNKENVTTVIFDPSFASIKPTSCYDWFKSFSKLEKIQGMTNLNTSQVTNMNGMFYGCFALTNLDISNFDTSLVTDMSSMFYGCKYLTNIEVSKFNTALVTNMSGMFESCQALSNLDISNFITSKVGNMNSMFSNCTALTNLNLSSFDTSNVTQMTQMFFGCNSLKILDLSNFNTSNVTRMDYMFMFSDKLTTIYASNAFTTAHVNISEYMFFGCESLVGVIPYDATKLDKEWANNVTGYFMPYYQINNTKYPALGDKVVLNLEDENTFEAQAPFNINEGSYTRHNMVSDWGTVCVPFVINTEDASTNCTFYQLSNINNDAIEISQINDATIAAGVPVIVKRNEGVTDLFVAAVKDDTEGTGVVTAPQNGTSTNHLEGTFVNQKVSKKCYFLAKNKFWYVGQIAEDGTIKGVHVYPFRAYLTCDDAAQPANELNIMVKDETNNVENPVTVDSLFSDKAEYYNAAGRRINTLQKGLNIVRVGGQSRKVMIK